MRSYSLFVILLLSLVIFMVDILAFYWLQSITQLLASSILKNIIYFTFWLFAVGLIAAIIILKVTLDDINPRRKQLLVSSLYGLTVLSFIPKLIFVIIISILYATNYMFSEQESLIIVPIVGLLSGFLPFFVIVNSIFRALYRFKIHRVTLIFDDLPKPYNEFGIVHISDLHLGSFNNRHHILERAVKLINHLKPDFIFFTGDLVNNYAWELKNWEKVLNQLLAKKGKYAVLGNHDYGDYSNWNTPEEKQENFEHLKQFYKDINFKLLLNEAEIISVNNENIAVIGVENCGKPPFKKYGNLKKALKHTETIPFKILLSHDPTHWNDEVVKETNIALTLSGHTHGMQAGFQYKDLKWSPIKYKHKHWAGLYKQSEQYLYVNRGLGWLGFPGRIGMRPEITFIELRNKN